MIKWDKLPDYMQNDSVREYYDILNSKKVSLAIKRVFDVVVASIAFVVLCPAIAIIAIMIKFGSPGKVVFKQERITRYGKAFYIYKFRTMVENAEALGSQVTVDNDARITGIGKKLRKYRLDELLQLINIIKGDMSFVGTRPEVRKYVDRYAPDMYATLLTRAGVTSLASICYKDEDRLLSATDNPDDTYVNEILPEKMAYNLDSLKSFSLWQDIKLMIMTVLAVCGKDYTVKPDTDRSVQVSVLEEVK